MATELAAADDRWWRRCFDACHPAGYLLLCCRCEQVGMAVLSKRLRLKLSGKVARGICVDVPLDTLRIHYFDELAM